MDSRTSNAVWIVLGSTGGRQHCLLCGAVLKDGETVALQVTLHRAPVIDAPEIELICKDCAGD